MKNTHDVGTGERRRIEYPDAGVTGGIRPCIGIGILNKRKQIGYLGHQLKFCSDVTFMMGHEAVREADSPADLFVRLEGNAPMRMDLEQAGDKRDEVIERYRAHGRRIVQRLLEFGIPAENIDDRLAQGFTGESLEMTVDTHAGEITVIREEPEGPIGRSSGAQSSDLAV